VCSTLRGERHIERRENQKDLSALERVEGASCALHAAEQRAARSDQGTPCQWSAGSDDPEGRVARAQARQCRGALKPPLKLSQPCALTGTSRLARWISCRDRGSTAMQQCGAGPARDVMGLKRLIATRTLLVGVTGGTGFVGRELIARLCVRSRRAPRNANAAHADALLPLASVELRSW